MDRCVALLKEIGAKIVRGPMEGTWARGYYYVLFEDPDGIRLEVNFVPGAGLLAEGVHFNPGSEYGGRSDRSSPSSNGSLLGPHSESECGIPIRRSRSSGSRPRAALLTPSELERYGDFRFGAP